MLDLYIIIQPGRHDRFVRLVKRIPDEIDIRSTMEDYYQFDTKDVFDTYFEEIDYCSLDMNIFNFNTLSIEIIKL